MSAAAYCCPLLLASCLFLPACCCSHILLSPPPHPLAVKDCWLYFIYTMIFVAVVYQINNSADSYSTNAALYDQFLDQEFLDGTTFKKTFFDINSFEELQSWVTGPLAEGLYQDVWYNGDPYSDNDREFLRGYLKLVGGVRLWQVRVSNNSCTVLQSIDSAYRTRFGRPGNACYGPVLPGKNADQLPFGPPEDPTRYKFKSVVGSEIRGLNGWGEISYGVGGYAVYLPPNRTTGFSIINDMLRDRFFDKNMRALAIDINFFNADTNLLTVSRFLLELLPTGLFLPSYRMYSFKLFLYATAADQARMAGEILVAAGCLYYMAVEVMQLWRSRPRCKYFSDPANAFDLMLQACMLSCIIYWVFHVRDTVLERFNVNVPCNFDEVNVDAYGSSSECFTGEAATQRAASAAPAPAAPASAAAAAPDRSPSAPPLNPAISAADLYTFAQNFNFFITFAGFLGLLMSMKFFKYFSISRRMNTLWLTLGKASQSLVAFTAGFCLMVGGFAFMGQMCFGSMVADFHTFESSFSTLLRYPLGDFDYAQLRDARPDMAAIFFGLYMSLVFLVCMNMVVAIITIAFEEINERLKVEERWKHAGRSYETHHLYRARVRCNACVRVFTCGWLGGDGTDQLQMDSEDYYLELMKKFIEDSESNSRVDLLRYMEDVHKSVPPGQNLYMGINEMCSLARDTDQPIPLFCSNNHREARNATARRAPPSVPQPWWSVASCGCCASCRRSSVASTGTGSGAPGDVPVVVSNPMGSGSTGGPRVNRHGSTASVTTVAGGLGAQAAKGIDWLKAEHHDKCIAWQLVHAYYAYKDVVCLGKTDRHQFWGDGLTAGGNVKGSWEVVKTNRSNVAQDRIISIEEDREGYLLTCRDMHFRLKRRVPITNIVQLEASVRHPNRAYVYIEAAQSTNPEGAPGWDSYLAITQDTVYDLTFDNKGSRDGFMALLMRLREAVQKRETATVEAALAGDAVSDVGHTMLPPPAAATAGGAAGNRASVGSSASGATASGAHALARLNAVAQSTRRLGMPRALSSLSSAMSPSSAAALAGLSSSRALSTQFALDPFAEAAAEAAADVGHQAFAQGGLLKELRRQEQQAAVVRANSPIVEGVGDNDDDDDDARSRAVGLDSDDEDGDDDNMTFTRGPDGKYVKTPIGVRPRDLAMSPSGARSWNDEHVGVAGSTQARSFRGKHSVLRQVMHRTLSNDK